MRHVPWIMLLLSMLPIGAARAQFSDLEYRVYVGTEINEMRMLRAWQRNVAGDGLGLGIPLQKLESFPPFVSVRGEISRPSVGNQVMGLSVGYSSTGGRLYYSDYSGFARFDQVISRYHMGYFAEAPLPGPVAFTFMLALRYNFSTVRAEAEVTIGEYTNKSEVSVSGRGWTLEPALTLDVYSGVVNWRLLAGLETGWGNHLNTSWRGLRFGSLITR